MDKKTEGAWIIHHTNKLKSFNSNSFEEIEIAGKCGLFLSGLASSDDESELSPDQVNVIAQLAGIKKSEKLTFEKILREQSLIDTTAKGGIVTIGLTTSSIIGHTSNIFKSSNPSNFEQAAIDLAEKVSNVPQPKKPVEEYISDTYKLTKAETDDLFQHSETIGLIDYETLQKENEKVYFNGNLFRRSDIQKVNSVLTALSKEEANRVIEMDNLLKLGCVYLDSGIKTLGIDLLKKLQSIGVYDINTVSNGKDTKSFITKPSAFAKFGNPFEEDAFDLAKAFVASLTYGLTFSPANRGRIFSPRLLLQKLINGQPVGPCTAIGKDYQLLELKRVVKLEHANNGMFFMWLLKKDIGEIALQVLERGDASEHSVLKIISNNVTSYSGPEANRTLVRKVQTAETRRQVLEFLKTFRS